MGMMCAEGCEAGMYSGQNRYHEMVHCVLVKVGW